MNHRYVTTAFGPVLGLFLVACGPLAIPNTPTATVVETETPQSPTLTSTFTPSPILSHTPIPTPPLFLIDDMEKLSNWNTDFCNNECGTKNGTSASSIFISLVSGQTNNAIEVLYDVRKNGWVLITRSIDAEILSKTTGISFSYKGVGALNSIELKLLGRYPSDNEDIAFGAVWEGVTDTGDEWAVIEAPYNKSFTCWWPEPLCEKHGYTPRLTHLNIIDITAVNRMDIAIAYKSGDTEGLGRVTFDDVVGIP